MRKNICVLTVLALSILPLVAVSAQQDDGSGAAGAADAVKVVGVRPGLNGFGELGPEAMAAEIPTMEEGFYDKIGAQAIYRSGYTDAYGIWWPGSGWDHIGSHTSDSDLFEDQIWADGYLKQTGVSGWNDSCSNRTNGTRAWCQTKFFALFNYSIYAETKHHFHTSGYVDSNFTTGDSWG